MRRPWTTATAVLTAVHNGYELLGGTGLPGQAVLGLTGAAAVNGTVLPALIRSAATSDELLPGVALHSGIALGAAAAHLVVFRTRRWHGIPLLADNAEGLAPGWDRGYNAVIYPWLAAAGTALVRETPRSRRRLALVGALLAPVIAVNAVAQQRWLDRQAVDRPRWWNRGHQAV
jgi:hypothetical protein